jgi:microcystin-dependent protein
MNLKTNHGCFKRFCMSIASAFILLCATGGIARSEDTVDRLDREVKELRQQISLLVQAPVGTIMAFGGDLSDAAVKERLAKQGWLLCDGAEKNADEYKELYLAIGTAFGGNKDQNKFTIPDLRGRFLRGADIGSGKDVDAKLRLASSLGGNTGDKVGSLQEDAFQGHFHATTAIAGNTNNNGIAGINRRIPNGTGAIVKEAIKDDTHGNPRISSETRPKNLAVNWIIKAKQVLLIVP